MIKPEWDNIIRIKLRGGPLDGQTREVGAHVQVFETVVHTNPEPDMEPKAFAAGNIKTVLYRRTDRVEDGAIVFQV